MYLYLGQETVIDAEEILGIFDLDNTSTSRITRGYLSAAEKRGQVVAVTTDLPKSFVVCGKEDKVKVFLTQISPATLKKRASTRGGISALR